MPKSTEKCERFRFMHPFTCTVAVMTGSGKTVWVKSFLQQAQDMATVPNIEFDKGISSELENDSFFNTNKRNLMVINDQMEDAGGDRGIVNLFTRGSHYRNLSVIYIVQNLFHQGKNSRSNSLNSHYLVLLKNPRDKLAKQMYPGNTDLFIKRYEEAVRRPFGYLLVDLKTTTQDNERSTW